MTFEENTRENQARIEAILQAFFNRAPFEGEVEAWLQAFGRNFSASEFGKSLRNTDEYLQSHAAKNQEIWTAHNSRRLMFVHIPKCGGTSVDLSIRERVGIPPHHLLDVGGVLPALRIFRSHEINHTASSLECVWPYVRGHVSVNLIPKGFTAFTVFRESISRILSLHRFVDSSHFVNHVKFRSEQTGIKPSQRFIDLTERGLSLTDLLDLLEENNGRECGSFAWMFADGITDPEEFGQLNEKDRRECLQRGVSRLSCAAWLHDPNQLSMMLVKLTGEPGRISKENETPRVSSESKHVDRITERDWQRILCLTQMDDLVIDIAVDLGLISQLDPKERLSIIGETAKRLRYELPEINLRVC